MPTGGNAGDIVVVMRMMRMTMVMMRMVMRMMMRMTMMMVVVVVMMRMVMLIVTVGKQSSLAVCQYKYTTVSSGVFRLPQQTFLSTFQSFTIWSIWSKTLIL